MRRDNEDHKEWENELLSIKTGDICFWCQSVLVSDANVTSNQEISSDDSGT